MAAVRPTRTGKWELTVRHPALPKGRKFFTFDTEAEARTYGNQWDQRAAAGLAPPQTMLEPEPERRTLGVVIRAQANSPSVSAADVLTLQLLMAEVGGVKISALTYAWAEAWVQTLKLRQHLAPSSIRKRVGCLARALDAFLRRSPDLAGMGNPLRLLPAGYSAYTDADAQIVEPKHDQHRTRRLEPGEERRILAAIAGEKRADRERPLALAGDDLRVLYLLIANTGLRLKEAYTLRRRQIELAARVVRAQSSKQRRGKVKPRTVPLVPELHAALTAYISRRGLLPDALLFPFWRDGEPEKRASNRLSQTFRRVFDYAGCDGLTEHDLRHEATCRWFELRTPDGGWLFRAEEIHSIMGWAPGSAMAQVYASFRGDDLADRLWRHQAP